MAQRGIPKKESLEVEFMSDLKRLPDVELIDTVVALSNSDGGELYVGVEDDGTPTGVHPAHANATRLAAFVANKTIPPVPVRVTSLKLDENGAPDDGGKSVVVVEVPKSRAIVASADGKVMRRRLKADGTPESVPLYPYEIITRLSTIGQLDYSACPVLDTCVEDFSTEELSRLRSILKRNRNSDQTLLELDDGELLAALRMTTVVDGRVTPTVTGILLAGEPCVIERVLPTSKATFQVIEGTEVRVNQDFDGPLLRTIEKMLEMLEPWNPEREFEYGLFRQSVPEFDRHAFREALVNAFGHRDYAALGRVRVVVDDEGLTIANPGGFVEGVTLKNLLTVEPHGRNECLMSALKRVGIAEKAGRGIDRIFEGSLAYGRPLPDYSGSTTANVVLFVARSAPDESFMKMLNDEHSKTGRALSLRSLLVLDALKREGRLTASELSSQLNFGDATVRATVEALVEAGLVEAHERAATREYMLSASACHAEDKGAGSVRQSDIDKARRPELIMELAARQGGQVTTGDVMDLLHLTRKQAFRQLKALQDDHRLTHVKRGRNSYFAVPEER